MKCYVDIGSHWGEGLDRIAGIVGLDETWGISFFEPNPLSMTRLLCTQLKYRARYFPFAVGAVTGIVGFNLQHATYLNGEALDGAGSCLISSASTELGLGNYQINVFCVSLDVALDLALKGRDVSELVLKIDIEGAEYGLDYTILPSNIPVTIFQEWHNWGHPNPEEKQIFIKAALPSHVRMIDWD